MSAWLIAIVAGFAGGLICWFLLKRGADGFVGPMGPPGPCGMTGAPGDPGVPYRTIVRVTKKKARKR